MRRTLLLLLSLALLALPGLVVAQQAAPGINVTITGARGDAANRCDSATTAANSQTTLTLQNPGPGLSNYITSLAVWGMNAAASSAATPTQTTLTGHAGTSPKIMPLPVVFPAAGAQGGVGGGYVPLVTPLKGLAGTANAIVGPTGITGIQQEIDACYYAAP